MSSFFSISMTKKLWQEATVSISRSPAKIGLGPNIQMSWVLWCLRVCERSWLEFWISRYRAARLESIVCREVYGKNFSQFLI